MFWTLPEMAHGLAQIHAALVAALTGLTTTGAHIFDDETTPIPDTSLPALRILDEGEPEIEYATQKPPRTLIRSARFTVRGLAKAADAKATLNAILADVEVALYNNRTLGGKARDMRFTGSPKIYSDELETRVGEVEIPIVVDWVSVEGSPQTTT